MFVPAFKSSLQSLIPAIEMRIRRDELKLRVIAKIVVTSSNINSELLRLNKHNLIYFLNDAGAFLLPQSLFSTLGASQPQSWTMPDCHPCNSEDAVRR